MGHQVGHISECPLYVKQCGEFNGRFKDLRGL